MPSPFPRLTMVITVEQHQLLSRLSRCDNGKSAAAYVRGLLDFATPHLTRRVQTLEWLEAQEIENNLALREALGDELEDADNELEHQLSLLDPLELPGTPGAPAASEARPDAPALSQAIYSDVANDVPRRVSK